MHERYEKFILLVRYRYSMTACFPVSCRWFCDIVHDGIAPSPPTSWVADSLPVQTGKYWYKKQVTSGLLRSGRRPLPRSFTPALLVASLQVPFCPHPLS